MYDIEQSIETKAHFSKNIFPNLIFKTMTQHGNSYL